LAEHRAALAAGGARRRVVSFVVDSPEPMLWGGELVLRGGAPAGQVTSAAWGETVGACVGLALLRHDGPITSEWLSAGGFEVDVAGDRYAVRCSLEAPL
jgi:4-methylaminobutanoate oxidase (formaldehyde-forming)